MRAVIVVLAIASTLSAVGAVAESDPLTGAFTATATPMPYPFWNDLGHRCNAGVDPIHKTSVPFSAPEDGLLTLAAEGFIGDWDLFIVGTDGTELAASNREQLPVDTTGSERTATLLDAGETVDLIACNQAGAPIADVTWVFEPLDPALIAATVGIGDTFGSNYYAPQTVTITAGQAVAWAVTEGSQPHTVTADDDSFRGGTVLGGTFARVFDTPGVYDYFCEYHGAPDFFPLSQTGRVVVEAA